MSFTADKQTLDDLNLLGKYKPGSVYALFNKVHTRGGERLLDELFRHPLSDAGEINRRAEIFRYFQGKIILFPFGRGAFELVEDYLVAGSGGNRMATALEILGKRVLELAIKDEAYAVLVKAVRAAASFIAASQDFINQTDWQDAPGLLQLQLQEARTILADRRLIHLDHQSVSGVHYLLGHVLQEDMGRLCAILHYFDLYIAVGKVARERDFSYARALDRETDTIRVFNLRHPALVKGVGNAISLNSSSNVLFLTGANMAGKSTLMKSLGIAIYLAHMGFPVAADALAFSVRDGLYSSINVPDDLSQGYSHFYAEVQRVKKIAEAVSAGESLVIIFDELFKGTNVKDAYDATLAVTLAFADYRNCCFVISTHITEVAEAIAETAGNVQFVRLPTLINGGVPTYTYTLELGVSADRHGMTIIEQEGILELIQSESKKTASTSTK